MDTPQWPKAIVRYPARGQAPEIYATRLKSKAIDLAHMMRGAGGQFGYPLITTIAASVDLILNDKESLTPEKIEILNHQAKALKLVSTKKMAGEDGESSRMLLNGLESLRRQLT